MGGVTNLHNQLAAAVGVEPPLARGGEVVTVELDAMCGGRPLPMQDPKVGRYV